MYFSNFFLYLFQYFKKKFHFAVIANIAYRYRIVLCLRWLTCRKTFIDNLLLIVGMKKHEFVYVFLHKLLLHSKDPQSS